MQQYKKAELMGIIGVLLLTAAFCGYHVHRLSAEQKAIKQDYSIVNSIGFGILSINKWRNLMVAAVSHRVENFQLTRAQQDTLQKEVDNILNSLIDKADSIINGPQRSIGGKLRKLAFRAFVNEKELHRQVPAFSHKIMAQLLKPRSKERLAYLAKSKLEDLGEDTYDSSRNAERARLDSIFHKYNVDNETQFDKITGDTLITIRKNMYAYAFGMLGSVVLVALLWYFVRHTPALFVPLYILSIIMAMILLLVGLTSTMIEIDARINRLDFQLIGEAISFKDQVIFFQSKSIVDVVRLLVRTGRYDSILVGILILCFSIFFPVVKLLSTGIYLLGRQSWARSKPVTYFAFHSGKWSMADVMVVAIFMAYIGFNGILDDQMGDLNFHSGSFTSIATNHTALQPGYLVFVGYVLYGLVLSQILKWITGDQR
ncbi:MAG: paraquat-inducible protein A [Bacteroidetes bacterium]|nr:paraquat-inducible protein A [Bacteroidota bacterium]